MAGKRGNFEVAKMVAVTVERSVELMVFAKVVGMVDLKGYLEVEKLVV